MEDVIYYELFIKNMTAGNNYFSLVDRVNTTYYYYNGYYSLNITNVRVNNEYHFMYRAVNYLGPGLNSSVLSVSNVVPP